MLENKEEDKIYILQSNHFVEEYLNELPICPKLKENPRFQAIIWHISVMLKREGIPFQEEQAKKWIENQIHIGKNGEVGYMLNAKDRYYPDSYFSTIQFVQYAYNGEQVQRHVKEVNNQETTMEILSYYNEDGIEEKQLVWDDMFGKRYCFERVRNNPELSHVHKYDISCPKNVKEYYEERTFLVGLEDLSPNLIEMDPLEANSLLKYGSPPQFYSEVQNCNFMAEKMIENEKIALPEQTRQEHFNYYQQVNKQYGRTSAFEKGLAKLFMVRSHQR